MHTISEKPEMTAAARQASPGQKLEVLPKIFI
jgi:hypothetical protein